MMNHNMVLIRPNIDGGPNKGESSSMAVDNWLVAPDLHLELLRRPSDPPIVHATHSKYCTSTHNYG